MIPTPGAALLFDIDGTLADTDPLHLEAFNRSFAPFGHSFDRARFVRELQVLPWRRSPMRRAPMPN